MRSGDEKVFDSDTFIRESNAIEGVFGSPGEIEFDGHMMAFYHLIDSVKGDGLTKNNILECHKFLMHGLLPEAGKFRKQPVYIVSFNGYERKVVCTPPNHEEIDGLLDRLVIMSDKPLTEIGCWGVHDFFEHIHPFIDGNGRTGRCILNALRIKHSYNPIVIYERDKFKYYAKINEWRKNNLKENP